MEEEVGDADDEKLCHRCCHASLKIDHQIPSFSFTAIL